MPRGRPRKVDTQDALQAIMVAFWQNGYSGTSMNDLASASGMAKPGLYAAFGDKEALFEKALLHYFENYGGPVFAQLQAAQKHVVEDFRDFLGAVAALSSDRSLPAGCFLINSLVDCTYGSERHHELVMGLKDSKFTAIRERVLKAVDAGEMSARTDIDRAAVFLDGQFCAIAMLGRGGSSLADLKTFIETGLRTLPVTGDGGVFDEDLAVPTLRQ
ncbi:TetR/AcrR family transcriptional regulator [Roseibium aggregatum]|uniref:TetR/AcrR family transcriptional regulator n=1 Tax=Roseibium aggregatum TaxID=187304 RepID=A0A939J517_9HYPH|nr:TetR/AcrR family transcriptional regulator [Roseibium aggregatum]MBN9671760.1 TetR/AcrR family transcriptional regulator [Roseibium aggregatum]